MKKALNLVKFSEMENKKFEVVRITERLCEVCDGIIDSREQVLRVIQIYTREDYENLLTRSRGYDRAEVDLENRRIYFYDHNYPGNIHPNCIEKL